MNFNNFHQSPFDIKGISYDLIGDSESLRSNFGQLFFVWAAFNCWMEAITEKDKDFEMLADLSANRKATDAYEELMRASTIFYQDVMNFSRLWPVYKMKDFYKKIDKTTLRNMSEAELKKEIRIKGVKQAPPGWYSGSKPTWNQIIYTIYQVRCNLFHGSKSSTNNRDFELVTMSGNILKRYIEESNCFEWKNN